MGTYADRVKETTATTGAGTFTLAGAVTGYQSFASAYPSGTTVVYYCATDGTNWEVGQGTYTTSGTTLSRTTILASSSGGGVVNFPGPSTQVFVTVPAADANHLSPFVLNANPTPPTIVSTGTYALTATDRLYPTFRPATITLTGNLTLAIGGVTGTFAFDLSQVTCGNFSVTVTNGAGSVVLNPPQNLTIVNCATAATVTISTITPVVQIWTASTTWTSPANTLGYGTLVGCGGGGQGGGGAAGVVGSLTSQPGGGGGSGATPVIQPVLIAPSELYTVTIGTGGTGAGTGGVFGGAAPTPGANGGDTTFVYTSITIYDAPGAAGGEAGGVGMPAGVSAGGGLPFGGVNRIGNANPTWVVPAGGGWGGASAGASATPTSGSQGQNATLTLAGALGVGGTAGTAGATNAPNAGGCGSGGGGAGPGTVNTFGFLNNGANGRVGGAGSAAGTGANGANGLNGATNTGAGSSGGGAGGNGAVAGGNGGHGGTTAGSGGLALFYTVIS